MYTLLQAFRCPFRSSRGTRMEDDVNQVSITWIAAVNNSASILRRVLLDDLASTVDPVSSSATSTPLNWVDILLLIIRSLFPWWIQYLIRLWLMVKCREYVWIWAEWVFSAVVLRLRLLLRGKRFALRYRPPWTWSSDGESLSPSPVRLLFFASFFFWCFSAPSIF